MASGLCELVLVVSDVRRSAVFYRDVVGLIPLGEASDDWAWFWAGAPGVNNRLAVRKGPLLYEEHSPHPPGKRFGQVHFALQVERSELDRHLQRVRAAGVPLYGPQHFDWMKALAWYFYDPDGNLVEFWSPD